MAEQRETDPALLRRWVETWRIAGEELERIRLRDLDSIDTREAARQLLEIDFSMLPAASPTSGLVEQQAWFRRIGATLRKP